jgi:hypothetical protein
VKEWLLCLWVCFGLLVERDLVEMQSAFVIFVGIKNLCNSCEYYSNSSIEIFSSSIEVCFSSIWAIWVKKIYMSNRGGINYMIWRCGLEIRVRQFGAATIRFWWRRCLLFCTYSNYDKGVCIIYKFCKWCEDIRIASCTNDLLS